MLESNNNKKRKRIREGLQAERSGLHQQACRSNVRIFYQLILVNISLLSCRIESI